MIKQEATKLGKEWGFNRGFLASELISGGAPREVVLRYALITTRPEMAANPAAPSKKTRGNKRTYP
jgi:hypothetical protein